MRNAKSLRNKKTGKILVSALMLGVVSSSIMSTPAIAQDIESSAYWLRDVGESGNYNYYNTVNSVKTYYHIEPKSGPHYNITTEGTTDFSIKSIKPGTASYSYHVTPQGTSEARVGVGDFTGTIGSESNPVVFHSINVTPVDPDKGGAVYNHDNITGYSIYADFISNTTNNYGGGVRNGYNSSASIDKIVGDFVKNKAGTVGGAIANGADCDSNYTTVINEITGNFIGNSANNGGAIYNQRTIGKIIGDFLSNSSTEKGGAITNTDIGTIGIAADSTSGIIGNFVSNTSINGGAIYNEGAISNIVGDFILNTATTNGGAINNQGTAAKITNITGNFSHNFANGGGAIYNFDSGEISNIAGNFEDNSATNSHGGAISNFGSSSKIGNIAGNFKGNHADGTNSTGGAIYNGGTIGNSDGTGGITGDFENNSATSMGGAIVNGNTINKVTGNFTNNSAKNGGAVYNLKTINFVAENNKNIIFDGNYVTDESGNGGAIFNGTAGTVGLYASADHSITFTGDTTKENVDSIYNANILNINGDGTITPYTGTVNLYNVTDAAIARGITNIYGGTVNAKANFKQNELHNEATFNFNPTDTTKTGEVGTLTDAGTLKGTTNILAGSFTVNGDATQKEITVSNGATLKISGDNSLIKTSNITNSGTIDTVGLVTPNLTNNGSLTTSGGIEALIHNNANGSVTINGDARKIIELNNSGTANLNGKLDATNSIIQLIQNAGVMNFSANAVTSTANLPIDTVILNGGTLNLQNNNIGTMYINNVTLNNDINLMLDADLAEGNIDNFNIASFVNNGNNHINITGFKILSDADTPITSIVDNFWSSAPDGLIVCDLKNIAGYSPIYKYDVEFGRDFDGDNAFIFTRESGYEGFNPSVMAGAVAAQVGGYLNQLTSYDNAFEHMDMYMLMTKDQRTAMKMLNRYAAAGDAANLATYNPNQLADESKGIWIKPYATFEKVNLKSGPNVENTAYGTFLGGDTDLIELKNGWDMMYSAYASYDGSHQNYDGVSIWQNGGHLGGTATWYKGNFFTGLTLNAGASVADASTMYGTDNMTMLMAGVASKTGYNWELLNSRLIVQPSMLMSYSFVNTFDYKNAAGINISSDPLHAIQLAPGLKFIGNLPHGWQPYIGVQMVWNIMDETKFSAANVNLPQFSTKPYFQYGIGVQKKWGERFSGYLQAMLRNGGRTGIALSAGFRWALGKDVKNSSLKQTDKQMPNFNKTTLKLDNIK